jgi:hypothetical protein
VNFDKILEVVVNKLHIIIGTATQAAVLAYHFKTGHDIGSGIQNSLYGFYAFLTGHALTYQKYPDVDPAAQGKTT